MTKCPKCGAERFEGRHITFHCGSYCTPKGTWEHSGECNASAKVNELESRVAELESQLAERLTLDQVCDKLNSVFCWEGGEDIAELFGLIYEDGEFRKAVDNG